MSDIGNIGVGSPATQPFTSLSGATAAGSGLVQDFGSCRAFWTAQIITAAVTAMSVVIEGSLDGVHWQVVSTQTNVAGILVGGVGPIVRYMRATIQSMTGTSITVILAAV